MISVNDGLPIIPARSITVPVLFVVSGRTYEGTYHENGWFYSDKWFQGRRDRNEIMAQGPRAECRMQTWDELPKHKVTEWEYLNTP